MSIKYNSIRKGVQRVWPQWFNSQNGSVPTVQAFVTCISNGDAVITTQGGEVVEWSEVTTRMYPCLPSLPGRMTSYIGSQGKPSAGKLDALIDHVASDLISIAPDRQLSVLGEAMGVSKTRQVLPGVFLRGDLFALFSKLDVTGIPAAVQQIHLAMLLAATITRRVTVNNLFKFAGFVTSDGGGLDEDGVVLLIYESLLRFAHEQFGDRKHYEAPEFPSGAQGCKLLNTVSPGVFRLVRGNEELHIERQFNDHWVIRRTDRNLVWRGTATSIKAVVEDELGIDASRLPRA